MPMASSPQNRDYGTTTSNGNIAVEKNGDVEADADNVSSYSDSSSDPSITAGVKRIEAISQAWGPASLAIAYLGIVLITNCTSLEQQSTAQLGPIATSSFQEHSLVSTVTVVNSVFLSVVKPIMAKLSDVSGRLEAFSLSVFFYVIGYIQMAASNNVNTYASAQLFYAAGSTGLQILVQIFVADTTDLRWRAFFSSVPDIPFLWTVWVGPIIFGEITGETTWRWGYGIWTIVLPLAFLPLFISLFLNQRKARKLGLYPESPYKGMPVWEIIKTLWFDLDLFGLLLLTATVCLILIPLTIGATDGWDSGSIIAMFVVGGVCLLVFPFWERSKKLAPKAFFPRDVFMNRTVIVGFIIGFFYFAAYYLSVYPYFFSYLLVVEGEGTIAAGHITQIFSFASSVAAIIVSLIIRYTSHYKYFVTLGACVYTVGIGLMIAYRKPGASTATLVGCQIPIGAGVGILSAPAQLGVQAAANHQQVAAVTAIFLTLVEIGGAVGSAISGAIWTNNILPKLQEYLPPDIKGEAENIYGSVTVASTKYPLGTPARDAIVRAYQETMHTILIVGVCCAAILIPLSLLLKNFRLDEIDQKVKGRVIGGATDTAGDSEVTAQSSEVEHTDDPNSRVLNRFRWHPSKVR